MSQSTRPPLRRPLAPLERLGPWLAAAGLLSLSLASLVGLVAFGVIYDPGGQEVKGYTYTGTALGIVVALLIVVVFAYSLRKRALQERLVGGGTMMMWLWLHVVFGTAIVVLAGLHAGMGALSPKVTSGKLLFAALVALFVTGWIWRLRYHRLPLEALQKIGNYADDHTEQRAEQRLLEIENLAAGRSDALRALAKWCISALPDASALAARAQGLSNEERAALDRIHDLALSRGRALERAEQQRRYTRRLQWLRVIHVPFALAVLPLLVVHGFAATRIPGRYLELGTMPLQVLTPIKPSTECKSCHEAIYEQWKHSMHAHAVSSPVTWVQSNRVFREELDDADHPDPQLLCVNCHSPVGTALSGLEPKLPWKRSGYDEAFLMEGVGCTTCHQFTGKNEPGAAGFTAWWKDGYDLSGTQYGGIENPVGNSYHRSATTKMYRDEPEKLCEGCHNVELDRNGDGKIEKGVDLILQQTTQEYDDYRENGGASCFSCHMKVLRDQKRAANSASLVFEQSFKAPARKVHDHSFVGVDYPLDAVADEDPHRGDREALLRSAASIEAKLVDGQLEVGIVNDGTGHKLPTGLAFARQMWLEIEAFDENGKLIKSSGKLAESTDDLCDTSTMKGDVAALREFVRGCREADPELVNFQQLLCSVVAMQEDASGKRVRDPQGDFIPIADPEGGESPIQTVDGGPLPRIRPSDEQKLTQILPGEKRTFRYAIPPQTKRISIRLLFRSFPPYFLRALAEGQPDDEPQLLPLIKNLQIVEMAKTTLTR